MKQNQILKIYGTDYKDMTVRLLTQADMLSHIKDKNWRIGTKPNLVSAKSGFLWGNDAP